MMGRRIQPKEGFAGMLLFPRGRWARACACITYLHPRNSWTPGNAAIVQERRA